MSRCDFCGQQRTLTIDGADRAHAGLEASHVTICAPCVWRCAAKLVEHSRPPSIAAPVLRVIARPT